MRVDTNKKRVVSEIYGLDEATGITLDTGSVWVTEHGRGVVAQIRPKTNEVVEETVVGAFPESIAFGAGGIWTADSEGGDSVSRVDPKNHK